MPKIYFENQVGPILDSVFLPTPSIYAVPEEWKALPKIVDGSADGEPISISDNLPNRKIRTRRMCPAINDAFNFGYTLYSLTDIYINAENDDFIEVNAPIDISPPYITEGMVTTIIESKHIQGYNKKYFHKIPIKIFVGFSIKTDPGYSCWFTSPIGNNNLPIEAVDAVIDTDMLAAGRPFSFFVHKGFNGTLSAGTPILQVIPFKRDTFTKVIVEDFSEKEDMNNSFKLASKFSNAYKNFFWQRKKFL